MDYSYNLLSLTDQQGKIARTAQVAKVMDAIDLGLVAPAVSWTPDVIFLFQTHGRALGTIIYTVFDSATHLALASYQVRYGAAMLIEQVVGENCVKNQIALTHTVLPDSVLQSLNSGSDNALDSNSNLPV